MMIKAVIFDMDGTLLDSEPLYLKADLSVVAAHSGFMTEQEHDRYIGVGNKAFMASIREIYGIEKSVEDLIEFQEKIYMEMAREEIAAFPEMVKFAQWAKEQGLKIAIASGSSNRVIEELTEIAGVKDLFEHRISSEEVDHGKPAPDVLLETARRLGVAPEECLVIEDSPFGVEASRRAGMTCIAVPQFSTPDPKGYFDYAALRYKQGMQEFTSASLEEWIKVKIGKPVQA